MSMLMDVNLHTSSHISRIGSNASKSRHPSYSVIPLVHGVMALVMNLLLLPRADNNSMKVLDS